MVNPVWHQIVDFSRLLGLRDRLRCPSCGAVGTFKPHGGWLDFEDKRKIRRWLCKWCGVYHGPEGYQLCKLGNGQWEIADLDVDSPRDTPKWRCEDADPWRG